MSRGGEGRAHGEQAQENLDGAGLGAGDAGMGKGDAAMEVVGIVLVRDEDLFIEQAIRNVVGFCDRILVCDHGSKDQTPEILAHLAGEFPEKIEVHRVRHPGVSQELIAPLAGTRTWVFGVDGDELYDPDGLRTLRGQLEAGQYDDAWVLFGNVLNVKRLDRRNQTATGHLAPPCRSMTKLYNFRAIERWEGRCVERLHGGRLVFRSGFHEGLRRNLHEEVDWEHSVYRCLHLCFLRRSSLDVEVEGVEARRNIMDRHAWSWGKLWRVFLSKLTGKRPTNWKEEKYARGPEVTVCGRVFLGLAGGAHCREGERERRADFQGVSGGGWTGEKEREEEGKEKEGRR